MSRVHFVNLWKYWKRPNMDRDIEVFSFSAYDGMWKGTRIVFLNLGFVIRWGKS